MTCMTFSRKAPTKFPRFSTTLLMAVMITSFRTGSFSVGECLSASFHFLGGSQQRIPQSFLRSSTRPACGVRLTVFLADHDVRQGVFRAELTLLFFRPSGHRWPPKACPSGFFLLHPVVELLWDGGFVVVLYVKLLDNTLMLYPLFRKGIYSLGLLKKGGNPGIGKAPPNTSFFVGRLCLTYFNIN